jgi:anti-sigma factor RsiW
MTAAKQSEPSEVELLLPWYAAGTLSADEAAQVEAALASDPELASRYEWVRAEFTLETDINAAAPPPSEHDVETLFAKIDAAPARRPRRQAQSSSFSERIAAFLTSLTPRTLAWSATAAALAIALQAGVLADLVIKDRNAGGYGTASTGTNAQNDGAYVLIRFKPETTAADIANFLDANKFRIVGGPSVGQLFRVRVASNKLPNDDLMRIVTTLQGDKVVDFIAMTD